MKFFSFTKYFLYSAQKKCSQIQLGEDFQDFPPVPLNCKNAPWNFYVVTTRGFGDLYNYLIIIWRLIFAAARDTNLVSAEFLEIAGIKKDFLFLKLLLGSPLLLYMLIKLGRNKKSGAALFLPLLTHEKQITIRIDANNRRKSIDSLVSHEHIHLLQYRSRENYSKNIRHPDVLISDKYKEDKFLLYLLQKSEVEARLHELVISYYRVSRKLPLTIEGFLGLMAGSEQCGGLVIEALASRGIGTRHNIIKYHERDALFAEDVANVFVTIVNLDLRYRFIVEVLTVMYGNLICYYGDEESGLKFMSEIVRPNLYDLLYRY